MKYLTLIFAAAAIALASCEDILAPDISGSRVSVVAPVTGAEVSEGRVQFRWNALHGAEKYRVVVVSPDFERAEAAIRDTVLWQDSLATRLSFGFSLNLAPARYEWSIQAFNQAYRSQLSVRSLTVIPGPEPKPMP